ncbi:MULTISPECIES: hypothetical protein [unclassified Selenomonas]|uniref:hypothetical protein n=2 Tax=Selenomonas TaxID=970 RepID=UPI000495D719
MMNVLLVGVLVALCTLFVFEMKRSLERSSLTNELINEYAGEIPGPKRQELIARIYAYCARDRKLKKIIKKYQATEEDFMKAYKKLLREADMVKGRRYVPISSFFYVYTLEHILAHPEEEGRKLAMKCLNFFHF